MNTARQGLNGEWKLTWYRQVSRVTGSPEPCGDWGQAIPATVPGNVELDLVRAGIMGDPFVGANIEGLVDLEGNEWWLERSFVPDAALTQGKASLVFHGVDCFAEYWLNGEPLGESTNMLVEHSFDVTGRLKPGVANTLTVRIRSAAIEAGEYEYPPGTWAAPMNYMGLYVRKAPHMYGWDIMPRALSAGIWRDVELVAVPDVRFTGLYFTTVHANPSSARLFIAYDMAFPGFVPGRYAIRAELREKGAPEDVPPALVTEAKLHFKAGRLEFDMPSPRLWWPRGYGDQPLYDLRVSIVPTDGDGGSQTIMASERLTVGIRKVELIRTDTTTVDPTGKANGEFLFRVNGTPILVKGSNWVPADAFHSRDRQRIPAILELCRGLECNMLRCWGGNVYEDDLFYDLCDEFGFLVWQDFAMACAWYPQDDAFASTLREEAVKVVGRLRNHACLALWSGDNECDEAWVWNGNKPKGNRLTREILPQVVKTHDPYRDFLPSSPYFSDAAAVMGGSRFIPEQHLWGPRDYYKSPYYTEGTAHFVSEQGYHACPNLSSVERFISPEALWPYTDNKEWCLHATDPVPGGSWLSQRINLMADQVRELFGRIPDDRLDFTIASQISQAEALKFFIELTRLRKWRRTGILWWNVMDGWPQFSDAVVDYHFGKKLAYHYIKRLQQPFCPMMTEPADWHCGVVVGNDSRRDLRGRLLVTDADGGVLLDTDVHAQANTNAEAGRIRVSRGVPALYLMKLTTDEGVFANHYACAAPPLDLASYKSWLHAIAGLDDGFNAADVGK